MDPKIKKELHLRSEWPGYFTIICDDDKKREELIKYIEEEMRQIELLSDYSLKYSELEIKEKLQTHSVMLINLKQKLEEDRKIHEEFFMERYGKEVSKKLGTYLSLIRYREYPRKHPLILLCDSEVAKDIMDNDSNLTSFTRSNIMRLDKIRNIEDNER